MFKSFSSGQVGAWGGNYNAAASADLKTSMSAAVMTFDPAAMPDRKRLDLVRLSDLVLAICGIVVLAPLMILIALAIRLHERGPVLFRHQRVGRGGQRFACLKFRSMRINADRILADHLAANADAQAEWNLNRKLVNDPRVTPLGIFLRKTSFDELPQLFNVLFGQMSVVGPRPVVADELQAYGRYARFYLSVRPGVTGLWQVSGRNTTTYRRRVACDVTYVRTKCLAKNLGIIAMTVPAVLFGRGAY